MGRRESRYLLAAALLMLSACTKYERRPIDISSLAQSRSSATLDEARIDAMRARIAPDATDNLHTTDRLWALAAILEHDPKVATARAAVTAAEAGAKAQRHVVSPVLTLTGEYANDPATSSPWLIGGAIDLPLDIGGRRGARIRAADLDATIARYEFAETVWSERMTLRRALIGYFSGRQKIAAGLTLLELRDRQLAASERRLKAGEASKVDVEVVNLVREAAARDLAQAQSEHAQAGETIGAVLGVPASSQPGVRWQWPEFLTPDPASPLPDVAHLRVAAITARADVLRALADYDRADAVYRGEIAKQFPGLTVSPGYTWERGLVKLPLSVGLALPPLDMNRHAIAAAAKARDEAGRRLEEAVAAAGAEIDAALVERDLAAKALRAIRKHDLPVAVSTAKRADERLRLGDIDRTEWAEAQAEAQSAQLREVDAVERAQLAEAALEDALRRPLEGPETMVKVSALEVLQ